MIEFTEKEKKTIKSLISLGDSKELAEKTVFENRELEIKREASRETYYNAYCI